MLNLNWYRKDPTKIANYLCKRHGMIGQDIVIMSGNNASRASRPLCHRCVVEWLDTRFGVKEL